VQEKNWDSRLNNIFLNVANHENTKLPFLPKMTQGSFDVRKNILCIKI